MSKTQRVMIEAWGITGRRAEELKARLDGYAVVQDGESRRAAVERSIARRTGLSWASLRADGHAVEGGRTVAAHYCGTLGRPVDEGGWDPVADVWFSVPAVGEQQCPAPANPRSRKPTKRSKSTSPRTTQAQTQQPAKRSRMAIPLTAPTTRTGLKRYASSCGTSPTGTFIGLALSV